MLQTRSSGTMRHFVRALIFLVQCDLLVCMPFFFCQGVVRKTNLSLTHSFSFCHSLSKPPHTHTLHACDCACLCECVPWCVCLVMHASLRMVDYLILQSPWALSAPAQLGVVTSGPVGVTAAASGGRHYRPITAGN